VKLKFSEQKELGGLPQTIERLEREQQELFQATGDPGHYKKDKADIMATNARLEEMKRLLSEAYTRWEELEQLNLDAENNRLSK
jgi:ABC transport system ATP-binding/permease protein